jgi:hypothetical protein
MSARALGWSLVAMTLLAGGCGGGHGSPTEPDQASSTASAAAVPVSTNGAAAAATATHALTLTPYSGEGAGLVNITSDSNPGTTFNAQITFNVRGLAPNTTYYVQRASEFPASLGDVVHDGVCQRALGLGPWAGLTVSQRFITFVVGGQPRTITTSAAGAGAVHLENANNVFGDGTAFDVMFRVTDNPASDAPTLDLRTECTTVDVN